MAGPVVWHGTSIELLELKTAAGRYCRGMDVGPAGETLFCSDACTSHRMLTDQQTMNRLLNGRRNAATYRAEEFRKPS